MPKARTDTAVGLSREPGYYSAVLKCDERIPARQRKQYPFSIPAVCCLSNLKLDPKITILVGENGSGKSTIIEAIAVAAGMNAEGGSKNFRFSTRKSESSLHTAIELVRGPRKEMDGYFLRAECMYNVATVLEKLDSYEAPGPQLIKSYGEISLHDQSHGESFFAIIANRLADDSFIVMDEPESALSPSRQLYLLAQIHSLVEKRRCQIVLSTHSPILMSYPGALLYRLSPAGIEAVKLSETEHFTLTREFLGNYRAYLNKLFKEVDNQPDAIKRSVSRKGGDRATKKKIEKLPMFAPGLIRDVTFQESRADTKDYAFSIPAVRRMGTLSLNPKVTFLVGENGSGKSTIVEAIAVAISFNPEGGSKNHNFRTRPSESKLHSAMQVRRGIHREKDGFFLRAESLYNVSTDLEQSGVGFEWYGGISLHDQSHGESFLALANQRVFGNGLYIMDEPESALSPARQLSLMQIIYDQVEHRGSQFLIATHSPVLMSYPGATIYNLDDEGIAPIAYEDTEHFKVTRDFLHNPEVYLHHLLRS